jgi:hypothetical protein
MYTAVVLFPEEQQKLKQSFQSLLEGMNFQFQTPNGDGLPHHMTINLGSFNNELNDPAIFHQTAKLTVSGIYFDNQLGVCAARVIKAVVGETEIFTINQQKHITMALKPGVKPFISNKIQWNSSPEFVISGGVSALIATHGVILHTMELSGIIQECL